MGVRSGLGWSETPGQATTARGEERETCGRDSGENGQFQATPRQDKGGRCRRLPFPVSDGLIGGRRWRIGAGRGGAP